MKTRREDRVPPQTGRRLTKGNRELVAGGRPETVGEETRYVNGNGQGSGATNQTSPGDDEQQSLALLRELVSHDGPVKAAETLCVIYRTVTRGIETNTLTGRMEDTLKRRQLETGGAVAEPVMRRLGTLERRQELLEKGLLALAREVGARLAKVSGDPGELRDALLARDREGRPGGPGERAGGEVEAGREVVGEREPDATPAARGAPQAVIGRPRRVDRPRLGHPEVVTLKPVQDEELDYGEAMPLVVE